MQWTVGAVKVSLVREALSPFPIATMYPNADPGMLKANLDWLAPYVIDDETLLFSVHAFVIDTGDKVIMVDACLGEHDSDEARNSTVVASFLPSLEQAGYAVEDVDVVLCTHLHNDHMGWLTRQVDGRWVPTFPNAQYLIGRTEYDHADGQKSVVIGGFNPRGSFDDTAKIVVDGGQATLVDMDHRICNEVTLEPAPGHTPGQVTVRVHSRGEEAVITADTVHHPLQLMAPHWQMFLDFDPPQAVATRTALFNGVADKPVRVFGTHFAGTSSGYVERVAGDTFRFREG